MEYQTSMGSCFGRCRDSSLPQGTWKDCATSCLQLELQALECRGQARQMNGLFYASCSAVEGWKVNSVGAQGKCGPCLCQLPYSRSSRPCYSKSNTERNPRDWRLDLTLQTKQVHRLFRRRFEGSGVGRLSCLLACDLSSLRHCCNLEEGKKRCPGEGRGLHLLALELQVLKQIIIAVNASCRLFRYISMTQGR